MRQAYGPKAKWEDYELMEEIQDFTQKFPDTYLFQRWQEEKEKLETKFGSLSQFKPESKVLGEGHHSTVHEYTDPQTKQELAIIRMKE